jgi:hypothetical protein
MDVSTVACNVCGRQKQETNHWLVAIVRDGFEGILFQPAEACSDPRNPDFKYEDICGQECSHKRLSRWLDTLNSYLTAPVESVAA